MDSTAALSAFGALGQKTRLDVFRLLVQVGPTGMTAGEISASLSVRQNTMSTNLAVLVQAGLLRNRREGRSIRYWADMEGMRGLLGFLMEDCCGGTPAHCQTVLDAIACPVDAA